MVDRQFNEVELRMMLDEATHYRENDEPGRWAIETRHLGRAWEVIVEPAPDDRLLILITAYSVH
jgi:hypothetical protein